MTGRRYYITTLADWHRHAHRFANSHWLALSDDNSAASRELTDATRIVPDADAHTSTPDAQPPGVPSAHDAPPSDAARIIVLVDADEGVHLALDDDALRSAAASLRAKSNLACRARSARSPRCSARLNHLRRRRSHRPRPPAPAPPRVLSGTGTLVYPENRRACAPLLRRNPSDLGFGKKSHSMNGRG
jgi:hypothetical protein